MRRPRFLNTILGVVIAAGCAGDPASPLEPQASTSLISGVTGTVSGVLLQCTALPSSSTSALIGVAGGVVDVGPHRLVIPEGALKEPVLITAEVVPGNANSVRFGPEGLRFERTAALTMSYRNCNGLGMLLPKKIVYTDELLNLLELLRSVDLAGQKMVTGDLKHFSRYAIAF